MRLVLHSLLDSFARTVADSATMLESKDAVLVATSIVLAISTIVSISIELERQTSAVGRLTASKCEFFWRKRNEPH